jgi:hypothetical protein
MSRAYVIAQSERFHGSLQFFLKQFHPHRHFAVCIAGVSLSLMAFKQLLIGCKLIVKGWRPFSPAVRPDPEIDGIRVLRESRRIANLTRSQTNKPYDFSTIHTRRVPLPRRKRCSMFWLLMSYREPLPENCPPIEAEEIAAMRDVFRLAKTNPATLNDFDSQRAEKPEAIFQASECHARGVSVFSDRSGAENARKLPKLTKRAFYLPCDLE